MTDLQTRIEALRGEISEAEKTLAWAKRQRATALADAELAKAGSEDASRAGRSVHQADVRIADLLDVLERRKSALDMLERRAELLGDPAFKAEADAAVAEAAKLRADLDTRMAGVAKATEKLAKELATAGAITNRLSELDGDFDLTGAGRASVVSWLDDHLAFFTGRPRYAMSGAPEVPGTGYRAAGLVEASIRRRLEKRAAERVRAMAGAE